jgi:tetratricopeptide (TPR) repeat protein
LRLIIVVGAIAGLAIAFQITPLDPAKQARAELFAGHYSQAIGLYRQALAREASGESYYGLTRALLKAHRSKEAYAAAGEALEHAPQTPGAQTAAVYRWCGEVT